ncbi:MAG TPA: PaaI family thioesterase [Xanthobacteraceae bacterium]|jgi:uncharacterized protein (TIGR00369 family)|nr:PaaI family thioesterase [Xanthobacteraceae bacterium]
MSSVCEQTDALARLREEMTRPPYHAILQPQAVRADPAAGLVVISLAYRPEFRRGPDDPAYHGGVIATLIDIAGHAAVAVHIGRMTPTIDLRIDYLRPAGASDLTATARLVRAGRSVARADVEIADADGRLIAIGRGSFSTLDPD